MADQRLATLIRNKYPGSYDDISDDELEKQVLAKYPEYKDLVPEKKVNTLGSRLGEGLSGLKEFASNVIQAPFNPSAAIAVGTGMIQPFKELGTSHRTNENIIGPGGYLPDIGERIARFSTGILGGNYEALNEDIQEGNYGAILGDLAIPAGMLFGPKLIGKGLKPKGKLNIPELVDELPSEVKLLNAPEVRGYLPAIGETTVNQPTRFFAGRGGIADANMQYILDTAEPRKLNFQDLILNEKGKVKRGVPSILPEELGEVIDVGPEIAPEIGFSKNLQNRGPLGRFESGFFDLESPKPIPGLPKPASPNFIQQFAEGGEIVNQPKSSIFEPVGRTSSGRSLRESLGSSFKESVEPKTYTSNDIRAKFKMEPSQAIKKGLVTQTGRNSYTEVIGQEVKPVKTTSKPGELTPDDFGELHAGLNPNEFFKMLRDKLGTRPRVPYTGRFFSETLRNTPQGDIVKFLSNVKPLLEKQSKLRTEVKSEQAARMSQVTETGEKGSYIRRGMLKGELPKIGFEPIRNKFTPEQIAQFHDQINFSKLGEFDKVNAVKGLDKILDETGSTLPVPSEMRQLAKVFGKDFTDSIIELHAGLPLPVLTRNMVVDAINAPKASMTGLDVSAPLRQGAMLAHQPSFWKNLGPMLKSFTSKRATDAYEMGLKSDPIYEIVNPIDGKYDIGLTEISENMSREAMLLRDEQYASSLAHKYIPWVKPSERAFNTFLNRLRFDSFKSILIDSKKAGIKLTPEYVNKIAAYIKNASGRGSLGRLEKIGPELNAMFFSPKFVASRLHMLNPKNYLKYARTPADKMIRKQYLKSALSMISLASTTYMLGHLLSDEPEVSGEPLSSDFAKLKMGNTRLDPFAGLQQPVVAALRFTAGKQVNVEGEEREYKGITSRWTPLGRFMRSKFSPTAAFVYDMLDGKDITGKKFNVDARIMDTFIPIVMNDLYELAKDDPKLLAALAPLKLFGMGGQTFNQSTIGDDIFGREVKR